MGTQITKEWFYVLNEQKCGPINKQELLEELTNGTINASTLVWREGMHEWEELLRIDALLQETLSILRELRSKESASVTSSEPPPIPNVPKNNNQPNRTTHNFTAGHKSTNNNDKHIQQPTKDESKNFLGGVHHPWRRFFARTVDLMSIGVLIFLLLSFSVGYLFPQNIDGFVKFIENPIVAIIVLYVLWLPVEALFLSFVGTTPAKWIFGVRVTSLSGENLSYGEALKRAFLVFIQGEGFGIPLVNLFTRLFAYRRLTKTGTTLWDTSVGSVVTHKKWGVIRAIASIFVTLVVLVIISILNQMGNSYG